jgi:hypothetical protein
VREELVENWKTLCYFSVRELEFSARDICANQGEGRANHLYWEMGVRVCELDLARR